MHFNQKESLKHQPLEQEPLSTLVVQQELQTFDDLLLIASFHLQPLEIDPGSLQKRD